MPVVRLAAKKTEVRELTGKEAAAQRVADEAAAAKEAQDILDGVHERPPWHGIGSYRLDLSADGPYANAPLRMWYNQNCGLVCTRIVVNDSFNGFIIAIICLAGILVGLSTYYDEHNPPAALSVLDLVILTVFIIECGVKIVSEGTRWWRYFTGPEWRWCVLSCSFVAHSLTHSLTHSQVLYFSPSTISPNS